MISFFIFYFFLLGLVVGSFLNVVILRYHTGRGIGGRSGCMTCKRTLSWYELVPVASWVLQKGKCRGCKTKVSMQYPVVELITGLLFAGNFFYIFSNTQSVVQLILLVGTTTIMWALFVIVFVYDLRHKIIPDAFSFALFGLSVLFVIIVSYYRVIPTRVTMQDHALWAPVFTGMAAGMFFYFCVWFLWKISKGTWIGLGDAKLLLSIGTVLGFVYGLSAIFIAFWIGTIYAVYIMCIQRLSKKDKHITMKTEIPLGPFLIIGFSIVYFTNIDVTNLGFLLEHYAI